MRNLYSLFFTALLACISIAANAINITVNVDDPSRVSISVNYTPVDNIVAGDNQFTVEEYQQVSIKAKDNAFITKVVKSMEGADDSEEYVSNMSECNLYISSYNAGATWTVTSVNADEARDGACRVYVDDPANVMVQRSGTYSTINLEAGWNDMKFMTDKELPLTIGPKNYGSSLYQVKVNGEVVSAQGNTWRISPKTGDEVEIFANFPDVDIPVSFTYTSEEAKGFITNVTVNGTSVDNYNDEDFTVKAGSEMTVYGNTSDYSLSSFTVNGNSVYFYGQYNFVVTEETVIAVDAHKYGTVKATINIDNADNVIVYKGYSYSNDIMSMVSGDNEIELSETNAMIQIKAASGCYITSVTDGTNNYSADYSNSYTINVTDGMVITVKSGAIERNSKAVVYIDSKEAAATYFNFQRNDRSSIDVATGYNEINFYDGDNPFGLSWYGASYANVYKNNETVQPLYTGATTYEFSLVDGDVVKVFLASDPETYEAELSAGDGVDASKVVVTMDRMMNVAGWVGKHSVLQETEISIKPAEDYDVCVKVDGTDLEAGEDGAFVITVNKNTAITVSLPIGTGINAVGAEKFSNAGVYNMQGVRMAGDTDMKQMPAGVYIVNGRKVVKR
ncbi:MAG: hypothetical protein K2H16_01225 [Prevotella sp.]|nr:hypothetical protein [Prevotella sp.]